MKEMQMNEAKRLTPMVINKGAKPVKLTKQILILGSPKGDG